MSHLLNETIWWTGAGILGAGAALAAAALIAGLALLATELVGWGLGRFFNLTRNMCWVHEWVRAGKPKWHWADGHAEMRPSVGDGE